jgi:hypothetical protein
MDGQTMAKKRPSTSYPLFLKKKDILCMLPPMSAASAPPPSRRQPSSSPYLTSAAPSSSEGSRPPLQRLLATPSFPLYSTAAGLFARFPARLEALPRLTRSLLSASSSPYQLKDHSSVLPRLLPTERSLVTVEQCCEATPPLLAIACVLFCFLALDTPVFRPRFRMSRPLFRRIVEALQVYDPYFKCKNDCIDMVGFSSLQKCMVAMRLLAYGAPGDTTDDYLRMAESTALDCL